MAIIEHIRYLAETIGPRGSTRPPEKRAAEYAEKALREAGLEPVTEGFQSGRSTYYPFALFAALVLVSVAVFWWGGRWGAAAAALLTAASLVSVLLELAFRPNPFRWILPKGQSQNVYARIEPKGEARDNVVLIGHLDTHRTPLLFAKRWVRLLGNLVPLAMGACLLLMAAFVARIFLASPILSYAALPLAAVIFALFLLMMQADFTPFAAGANDNATGVGVVLETARNLRSQQLEHTRVWILASGCEEVGCYGADAFAVRHKAELNRPVWVSIDSVGGVGAGVTYLSDETFLLTIRSDPRLLEFAAEIARGNPRYNAYSHPYKGAYTEGAIGGKHGFRVLSFVNCRRDGVLPEWHRPTDTLANIDLSVVENTRLFVDELLRRIDADASEKTG
jgi:aminopeptidase YwaD